LYVEFELIFPIVELLFRFTSNNKPISPAANHTGTATKELFVGSQQAAAATHAVRSTTEDR